MTEVPGSEGESTTPAGLDAPDAALAGAMADDEHAPYDLEALAAEVGATPALLEAVERAGLLLPHHVDADGTPRYSAADAQAVRSGLTLLDAGLPLGELLDIARRTDAAVGAIAEPAVEAFLNFVRDPVRGTAGSDDEAAERLVTAYQRMLPATEHLVAHHLRRRLLATAATRLADEMGEIVSDAGSGGGSDTTHGGSGDGGDATGASEARG
jgi:DNA-binding transcriptional MerR regulator